MAQETLDRIRESELAARQKIKEAQDESARIISAAREEAERYWDSAVRDTRTAAQQTLDRAREALEPSLEAAQGRAVAMVGQLQKNFDQKKSDAVQMVIEQILDFKEA